LSFTAQAEPLVKKAIGIRLSAKALSVQAEIRMFMCQPPP